MRIIPIFAALTALLAAAPAPADVTARYAMAPTGPLIVVQANDRGDARLGFGNQLAIIIRDGVTYVVMADLLGTYAIRQEDMAAAIRDMMGDRLGEIGSANAPPEEGTAAAAETDEANPYSPTAGGTETVAGRTGTVWHLRPVSAGTPAGRQGIEMVISTDPDLAPIGRALALQFGQSGSFVSSMFSPGDIWEGFPDAVQSIVERGTLIRLGRVMRLHSVEHGAIPAAAFALPGEPLTPGQFVARMGWAAPSAD